MTFWEFTTTILWKMHPFIIGFIAILTFGALTENNPKYDKMYDWILEKVFKYERAEKNKE